MAGWKSVGEGLKTAGRVSPVTTWAMDTVGAKGGTDPWTQFDKKFISGDWDAKRADRERAEALGKENEQKQESAISGLQNRGQEYFKGAQGRIDERTGINRDYTTKANANLNQNTQAVGQYESEFQGKQNDLEKQARAQSQDATQVYDNMRPRYDEMMNLAQKEAKSAMTLQDAMDPNNAVASQTRGLYDQYGNDMRAEYNKEAGAAQAGFNTLAGQAQSGFTDLAGQTQQNYDQYGQASQDRYNNEATASRQRFEDAAAGENRLGLSNYGVLASLGAQAAGNAQGPGPMTVGQQLGNLAAANRQAGEAFANTQRRMQGLKDQGMMSEGELKKAGLSSRDVYSLEGLGTSTGQREKGLASMLGLKEKGLDSKQSLRNQGLAGQQDYRRAGLDRGFERSDNAYAMGLDAKDRYKQSAFDREALTDRNLGRQSSLRGEMSGYQGNVRGSQANAEGTRFGNRMTGDTMSRDTEAQRLADLDALESGRMDFHSGLTGMRMGRTDINTERGLGNIQATMADREASEYARRRMLGAGIQAAGTGAGAAAGGFFGGPGGAQMGAQAGSAMGGSVGSGFSGAPPPVYQSSMSGPQWNPNGWRPQQPASVAPQGSGMPQYPPPYQSQGRYNLGIG